MSSNLAAIGYLVAAICFILALRGLSSPASSRQGNRLGMIGMTIAILVSLALLPHPGGLAYLLIVLGIAIGGGINEPRDALLTILYGLLTNPDQLDAVRAGSKWRSAFEEGVRWVAPIQASSRLVMEDTEIRDCIIPKGDTRRRPTPPQPTVTHPSTTSPIASTSPATARRPC